MTDPTPTVPPPAQIPLTTLILLPLFIAGVAYTWDVAFGAADVPTPGRGGVSIQRYAAVTAAFCFLEAIVAAVMLVRQHQLRTATGVVVYLVVLAILAIWIGSFRS